MVPRRFEVFNTATGQCGFLSSANMSNTRNTAAKGNGTPTNDSRRCSESEFGTSLPQEKDQSILPSSSGTSSQPPSPSFSRESVPHLSISRRVFLELREQLRTSIPALVGMILYKIPWLLSLGFVGRIGPMELAAAALASALCDVTGMSLSVGLSSAITTLTGQARGELLAMAEATRKDAEFKRKIQEQAQSSERSRGMYDQKRPGSRAIEKCYVIDDEEGGRLSGMVRTQSRNGSKGDSSVSTIRAGTDPYRERVALLPSNNGARHGSVAITLESDYGAMPAPITCSSNDSAPKRKTFSSSMRDSCNFQSFQSSTSADSDAELPLLPMVFLYRGMFIQMCMVIPVGLWWLKGLYPLLIALGQPDHLSVMTQTYLRILTPGLWSYSINWTLTAWLQAIEMADVPSWAALIGGLLHVPFNLFFIHAMGWGWLGVGAATVMFQVVQPATMLFYLFCTEQGYDRLLEQMGAKGVGQTRLSFGRELFAAVSSPWGIYQYLELAIPGILVVSEWWASEVAIFLSGRLKPDPEFALSGMAIYQSINSACFMLPVGISVGGSTRVGTLLGANDPTGAGLASGVCVATAATLSCITASLLFLVPHSFLPSLFSNDDEIIRETSSTITLLSVYVFADGIQVALNGIIKGCGRQCITVPIVLTAYWLLGVPMAYYLSFIKHKGVMCQDDYFCGIVGLVGGMTAGTWVHFLLLFITITCTTNWDQEAKKAHDRLTLESGKGKAMGVSGSKETTFKGLPGFKLEKEIRVMHRKTCLTDEKI